MVCFFVTFQPYLDSNCLSVLDLALELADLGLQITALGLELLSTLDDTLEVALDHLEGLFKGVVVIF